VVDLKEKGKCEIKGYVCIATSKYQYAISLSSPRHPSLFLPVTLHRFNPSVPNIYNNPHATTAANTPPPTLDPILAAAPELCAGAADPVGLAAAFPCRLPIEVPPTPVPLTHLSSARSVAVELKRMSAHWVGVSMCSTPVI
jgi:hypothetical protein